MHKLHNNAFKVTLNKTLNAWFPERTRGDNIKPFNNVKQLTQRAAISLQVQFNLNQTTKFGLLSRFTIEKPKYFRTRKWKRKNVIKHSYNLTQTI